MKTLATLLSAALTAGLASAAPATIAAKTSGQGYQQSSATADAAKREHKCGEGKCGGAAAAGAQAKNAEGKCGEGKCGEGMCGAHDASAITPAAAASSAAPAAAPAKDAEGKCGEGKCGESKMKDGACGAGEAS